MSRVPFFLGIAEGRTPAIFEHLSGVTARELPDGCWHVSVTRGASVEHALLRCVLTGISDGTYPSVSGGWSLWGVMALGTEAGGVTVENTNARTSSMRIYRALARLRAAAINTTSGGKHYIAGPWTCRALWLGLPVGLRNRLFYPVSYDDDGNEVIDTAAPRRLPWSLLGDNGEQMTAIDYAPTQADIDNDADGSPTISPLP